MLPSALSLTRRAKRLQFSAAFHNNLLPDGSPIINLTATVKSSIVSAIDSALHTSLRSRSCRKRRAPQNPFGVGGCFLQQATTRWTTTAASRRRRRRPRQQESSAGHSLVIYSSGCGAWSGTIPVAVLFSATGTAFCLLLLTERSLIQKASASVYFAYRASSVVY